MVMIKLIMHIQEIVVCCQNIIEGHNKDLATHGAARGLVFLDLLSLAKGKSPRSIPPCTW